MKTKKVNVQRYVETNEILCTDINARFIKILYKYDDNSNDKYISVLMSKGDIVRNSSNASLSFNVKGELAVRYLRMYISNYELLY